MDTLRLDLRHAVRSLRNARATTVIAVLCIALGIGANTAIFSVVRAVLLESLPYNQPEKLVTINDAGPYGLGSISTPLFHDLEGQTALFSGVAAYALSAHDLGDVADPERVAGIRATTNLFGLLGAEPVAGRTFLPSDATLDAAPVVVLSEGFWRRRFGGDRAAIGSTLTLDGRKMTIVGVMPASFDFPVGVTHNDYWEPLDFRVFGNVDHRGARSLSVIARMRPGVDSTRATAGLATLEARLAAEFPLYNKGRTLLVRGAVGRAVGTVRPALLVLLGAVGLVLLIACANVASLTLVRAASRRREVAIRTALGAERWRLVRQLLVESVLLSAVGGALGLAIGWWGLHALLGLASGVLPRAESIGIDRTVLAVAALVSLATGVGVGLLPALRATKPDLRTDLADAAGKSSASGARHRTLKTLIVGEIALAVVLLSGAGLVIRSFVALMNVDTGFKADGVVTFSAGAPSGTIPDTLRYAQVYGPILDRLRALPGVRAAGVTNVLPVGGGRTDRFFNIVGRPKETDTNKMPDAELRVVSRGYFEAMGVRMLAGRDFDATDAAGAPLVAIVNQELARRYFPNENPIGRQIDFNGRPLTIVGVANAVRELGLDQNLVPEFYQPISQTSESTKAMTFVVSTAGDVDALARSVRDVVHSVVPQQPVYKLATMKSVVRDSLGARRLLLTLLGVFAGLAIVLSAAGVYGVMSYGVTQRTREIGIRIALGARSGEVASMVLRDVLRVAGLGVTIGLAASFAASRLMTSMLYGVTASDALTHSAVALLIAAVAVVAGAAPALRAARVDPLIAMRTE